jgi:hypothetical protein
VPCTKYVAEIVKTKVPYTVCRTVAEQQVKECPYQERRMVTETKTREVPIQVCKMVTEKRVAQVAYCETRAEKYMTEVTNVHYVAKQVPYTVTRCVPRVVCEQVPVQVSMPIINCSSCGGCGCN